MVKRSLRHKFHAKPHWHEGIHFASKLERRYFQKLELAKKSGELVFFLRQVPFHLPGGSVLRVDFQEFWSNGEVVFTDTKGTETEAWKVKCREVEAHYPVVINRVTRA